MLTNCHLSQLIHKKAKLYGNRTALKYRDYSKGKWIPISWNKFDEQVEKVSLALIEMGVEVGENIAVFSENKPECFFVDFGAYGARVVTIPFYATSSGTQVKYMIDDASIRFVFVGEQSQYNTAFSVLSLCPTFERIIIFDRSVKRNKQDKISVYFDEFLELENENKLRPELSKRLAEANFEDTCSILYTSGTTGDSKGVVHTYEMYHAALKANDKALPITEKDVSLAFLPLTHIFEKGWSYLCLAEGVEIAINLRPHDILKSLMEVQPTCMCSVPRFWEKVYEAVLDKINNSTPTVRKFLQEALKIGARYNVDYKGKGKNPPLALKLKYHFYEQTAIKLLKKNLGLSRGNFFPTAGATVTPEVERFVHAADICMVVGYGMTETLATISADHPHQPFELGSVGYVLDGIRLKINSEGEILLKGKTVTPGYYRRKDATDAAFDAEGWFHTGDAGYIKNGQLYLTDRIKDLYKTSNGKYIAPQMLESKLSIDHYIDQVVIIANKRKFVSALIVPNYSLLEKVAKEQKIEYSSKITLCKNLYIRKFFAERIDTLQQEFASYEKIKAFMIMPRPFSVESGELTNTLKIRRNVVVDHYKEDIEEMYDRAEAAHKNRK